jgi:hypothetical protein
MQTGSLERTLIIVMIATCSGLMLILSIILTWIFKIKKKLSCFFFHTQNTINLCFCRCCFGSSKVAQRNLPKSQDSGLKTKQHEHSSVSSSSSEGPVIASDGYLDPRQVRGVQESIHHDLDYPPKQNQIGFRTLKPLATYANVTKGIFIKKSHDSDSMPEHRKYNDISSDSLEEPVVARYGYLKPRQVHNVEEPIYHELEFPPK